MLTNDIQLQFQLNSIPIDAAQNETSRINIIYFSHSGRVIHIYRFVSFRFVFLCVIGIDIILTQFILFVCSFFEAYSYRFTICYCFEFKFRMRSWALPQNTIVLAAHNLHCHRITMLVQKPDQSVSVPDEQ